MKGTFAPAAQGECAGGYAAQCASGNCVNITPVGTPTGSGTLGGKSGKFAVTGMCITVDEGDAVDVPPDGKSTCAPLFGDFTINGSNDVSLLFHITGAYCRHQATSPTCRWRNTTQAAAGV